MVALILASHVVVNAFGIRHIRYTIYIAMVLNSVSIAALGIAVLSGAKTHNSAQFVFTKFFDGTAADRNVVGWSVRASPAYVAICGTLFSQYTLLGFDASAHLCEETRKAVGVAPWCLLSAVGASFVCGFLLLLCLLFSIQNFDEVRTSPIPILEIFTDSCGKAGGLVLITIVMLCVWHCGLFSMVSITPSSTHHIAHSTYTAPAHSIGVNPTDASIDKQLTHDVLLRSRRWHSP